MTRLCKRGGGRRARGGRAARPCRAVRVYPPLSLREIDRMRAALLQQVACEAGRHGRWIDIRGVDEVLCRVQMCAACCAPRAVP